MKDLISRLKKEKYICEKHLQNNVIERCNYIIEVGAFTVSTNTNRRTKLCNISEPTQFTKDAVDQILTIKFVSKNGKKVEPKIFTSSKWYQEKLTALDEAINYFKNSV